MDNCVIYSTYSRSFPDRELQNKWGISHAVLYNMNKKLCLSLVFLLGIFLLASVKADSSLNVNFNTSFINDTSFSSSDMVGSSSFLFGVVTDRAVSCRYSNMKGKSYGNMEGTFDLELETLHKKTIIGLTDGIYKYYIKCKDNLGSESRELEVIFSVSLPITAQVIIKDGLPVKEGKVEVKLVTSKIVSQTPTLSYSLDGASYNPIPLSGSENAWKGYFIVSKSEEEKVGSFKFQGKDLEGSIGTEITSGGVFLVDTKKPDSIIDIKSIGYEGSVQISWFFEQDAKEFKIYRANSPGIDKSDFYKSIGSKTYSDTSVEKGKTYYYKITAVDEAGNEGELSREVYATALLENTSVVSNGLEPRFLGAVDGLLSEIGLAINTADSVKQGFDEKTEKEKLIYADLKLEREIDSAKSELDSLRKEVENYKNQNLDKNELDKKLNTGKLKINTIKKKIPENMIILEEKNIEKKSEEADLIKIILEMDPSVSGSLLSRKIKKSMESAKENNFNVKAFGYNLEISYLDGTRKKMSLIKEVIDSSLTNNENISIIEYISKNIEESSSNIEIKNVNYNVLKEDPIISFNSDTKEIIYSLNKNIDFNLLGEIKTVLLFDVREETKTNFITGYFSVINLDNSKNNFGIILGILAVGFLFGYFLFSKRQRIANEKLLPLRKKLNEANDKIIYGKFDEAGAIYGFISQEYKNLEKREKRAIYGDIENLHKKINRR